MSGKFFKTPTQYAVNNFGLKNKKLYEKHPLHKFMYTMYIAMDFMAKIDPFDNKSFLVQALKRVSLGSISINTTTGNDYNRKRHIHTSIKYEPTTVVFHDVADGESLRFWKQYYEYYFYDGQRRDLYGYSTEGATSRAERYLIDYIDIEQIMSGKKNITRLHRPRLIRFEHDTLDYNSTDGLVEISVQLQPEYVSYETGVSV